MSAKYASRIAGWLLVSGLLVTISTAAPLDLKQNAVQQGAAAETAKPVPAVATMPMTPEERTFLVNYLQTTRTEFLSSIAGLSEAQWKFKSAPERWSVAECSEHIAVSEGFLFDILTNRILRMPATDQKSDSTDQAVIKRLLDRTQKAQAPEPAKPTGRWNTGKDVIEQFNSRRDHTIEFVEKSSDGLRNHVLPFGENVKIDSYQFLIVIAAHSSRHTAQINEVKAHPDFPKS